MSTCSLCLHVLHQLKVDAGALSRAHDFIIGIMLHFRGRRSWQHISCSLLFGGPAEQLLQHGLQDAALCKITSSYASVGKGSSTSTTTTLPYSLCVKKE